MSLGFARDSILDLAAMANEHEGSNEKENSSRSSLQDESDSHLHASISLTQKKNVNFSSTQQQLSSQSDSEVGLVLGGPPGVSGSSAASDAGSDAASSAGQSADQAAYSAFAYDHSAYGDYFDEADAWVGGGGGAEGRRGTDRGSKKNNVLCCLFPWLSRSIDNDEESIRSSNSSGGNDGIAATATTACEDGAEKSSFNSAENDDQEDAKYRGSLEVNDSVSLAMARELGLANRNESQTSASSAVSNLFHVEEKKGDEEDYGPSSAASTGARDSTKDRLDRLAQSASSSMVTDDDDVTSHTSGASGDTDVYGEKLTDKDRQAVMARLRLSESKNAKPPPEVSTSGSDSSSSGEGQGVHTAPTASQTKKSAGAATTVAPSTKGGTQKIKGILKHTAKMVSQESLQSASNSQGGKVTTLQGKVGSPDRRSLFPSYSSRRQVHPDPSGHNGLLRPESKKSVIFSPMARVVSVPSRHDMSFVDKAGVWWQRSDYDDFKKVNSQRLCAHLGSLSSSLAAVLTLVYLATFFLLLFDQTGRIIAKAMLQGGSEIWLSSNNAWEKRAQKNKGNHQTRSPEYDEALRKYVGEQRAGLDPAEEASADDYGSKWWCKFGHSRRGLEHVASMDEGRHRQRNVNSAMRHIIDEQRSQRLNHRRDPVKLAKVALQYTSWARDLALAAGASDADAVRTNFSRDAKDRGHYLRHGVGSAGTNTGAGESSVGPGKSRAVSDVHKIAPEILDANTSTHIYLQKKDAQEAAASAAATTTAPTRSLQKEEAQGEPLSSVSGEAAEKKSVVPKDIEEGYTTPDEGFTDVGQEAIHGLDLSNDVIAKQAAGFDQRAEEQHEKGVDIAFIHRKEAAVSVGAH